MSTHFIDRPTFMDGYIYAVSNALKNSSIRMKYYEETNDSKFLDESNDWLDVANIYMKEIKRINHE